MKNKIKNNSNIFKKINGKEHIDDSNKGEPKPDKNKNWWEIEFGRLVPEKTVLQATRQLGAFCAAGVPALDSIEMLSNSVKHKRLRITLMEIADRIRNGEAISEVFSNYPKIFPKYYSAILEASERNGDLTTCFETLTSYMERDLNAKRTIKSALYYPAILIVVAILAIFVLSVLVLPKFEIMFASLNTDLPWSTSTLLSFSRFMSVYWWTFVVGIAIAAVSLKFYIRKEDGKFKIDNFLLKLPLIGELFELIIIERFTRILASLSSAGVPLPEALELVKKSLNNKVYQRAINQVTNGVIQGKGLVEPLTETKVFPEETLQIIRIGELSGRLDQQLDYASNYYTKEVDFRLKNISTLFEPVILVLVGGGVGFVAISLVSAMYGIYTSTTLSG